MKMRPPLFCLTAAPTDRQPQHLAGPDARLVSRVGATPFTRPRSQHANTLMERPRRALFLVLAAAALSSCCPAPRCSILPLKDRSIERCASSRCRDLHTGRFVECPR